VLVGMVPPVEGTSPPLSDNKQEEKPSSDTDSTQLQSATSTSADNPPMMPPSDTQPESSNDAASSSLHSPPPSYTQPTHTDEHQHTHTTTHTHDRPPPSVERDDDLAGNNSSSNNEGESSTNSNHNEGDEGLSESGPASGGHNAAGDGERPGEGRRVRSGRGRNGRGGGGGGNGGGGGRFQQVFHTAGGMPEFVGMRTIRDRPTPEGYYECSWSLQHVPHDYLYVKQPGRDTKHYQLVMKDAVKSKITAMESRICKLQKKNDLLSDEVKFLRDALSQMHSIHQSQEQLIRNLTSQLPSSGPPTAPTTHSTHSPFPPPPPAAAAAAAASMFPPSTHAPSQQPPPPPFMPSYPQDMNLNIARMPPPPPTRGPMASGRYGGVANGYAAGGGAMAGGPLVISPPGTAGGVGGNRVVGLDYDAVSDGELTLRMGDLVEVLQRDPSGWTFGRLLWSSHQSNALDAGWFPDELLNTHTQPPPPSAAAAAAAAAAGPPSHTRATPNTGGSVWSRQPGYGGRR